MKMLARGPVRAVGLAAVCAALAGCGGGGTLVVPSVPYEGPVTQADYVGKTFPVYLLLGEGGVPSGNAVTGTGSITYNTDGSITLLLPRRAPIVLSPSTAPCDLGEVCNRGTLYEVSGNNGTGLQTIVLDNQQPTSFRTALGRSADLAFVGGFGFETLAADRPASATYDTAGKLFLTSAQTQDFLNVDGTGRLIADFSAGTISGTLLSIVADRLQLVGDGFNDDLKLQFELENGRITSLGFRGGISAEGEINIDGGSPSSIDVIVSNGSAEGAFFGEDAAAISGIFEGDLALSDGGTPLVDFEAAGFVSGAKAD